MLQSRRVHRDVSPPLRQAPERRLRPGVVGSAARLHGVFRQVVVPQVDAVRDGRDAAWQGAPPARAGAPDGGNTARDRRRRPVRRRRATSDG